MHSRPRRARTDRLVSGSRMACSCPRQFQHTKARTLDATRCWEHRSTIPHCCCSFGDVFDFDLPAAVAVIERPRLPYWGTQVVSDWFTRHMERRWSCIESIVVLRAQSSPSTHLQLTWFLDHGSITLTRLVPPCIRVIDSMDPWQWRSTCHG